MNIKKKAPPRLEKRRKIYIISIALARNTQKHRALDISCAQMRSEMRTFAFLRIIASAAKYVRVDRKKSSIYLIRKQSFLTFFSFYFSFYIMASSPAKLQYHLSHDCITRFLLKRNATADNFKIKNSTCTFM